MILFEAKTNVNPSTEIIQMFQRYFSFYSLIEENFADILVQQMSHQKPFIKGQLIQWPNKKSKKINNGTQNTT